LFALIAAQLFAGRSLRRLVRRSLGRPSQRELEAMLRDPLGDPSLRLMMREPRSRAWVDADGATAVAPPDPGPGLGLTVIEYDGEPAAALLHDAQLDDDPELLQAAGAVALLAAENAKLEVAWKDSLRELSDSRARIVRAADTERRKLERDLHDGAQQRLMAIQIKLRLAEARAGDQGLVDDLEAIGVDAQQAVEELRTLAHGIYPPVLRSFGLADAVRAFAARAPIPVAVRDTGIGRCARTIETAIYFCAMEAVQNAIKHAGEGARVKITLGRDDHGVRFAVVDDGAGIVEMGWLDGQGLVGMRDRIGAVGGELEILSSLGAGTTVRGWVPIDGAAANGSRQGDRRTATQRAI
jgi:signal transduction histidine kinase